MTARDWCGEWEATIATPDAVEQLGETDTEPPTPPAPRWIVDRVPTKDDSDDDGEVVISTRIDAPDSNCYVPWYHVHPGTPWAPIDAIPDKPFDPTSLDHNGWIRSRLPGEGDDKGQEGWVQIPPSAASGTAPGLVGWAPLAYIVPGQPWAPADSSPGEYQP